MLSFTLVFLWFLKSKPQDFQYYNSDLIQLNILSFWYADSVIFSLKEKA